MAYDTLFALLTIWWGTHYPPDLMDRVIHNQQGYKNLPTELPSTDGAIATYHCDHLGEIWWLRPPGQGHWESFLVADCAGDDHVPNGMTTKEWMTRRHILAEVDYATAERWGTVGRPAWILRKDAFTSDLPRLSP